MRATLVTRIFAPEPGAASFRLHALVRALAGGGAEVSVLTTRYHATPAHQKTLDGPDLGEGNPDSAWRYRVRRWPVLRDAAGYVRGYLPYLSFDLPVAARLLAHHRPDVMVVEPPPTTGVIVRLMSLLLGVPYVYYAADVWSDAVATTGAHRWVQGLLRAAETWAWRGAEAVLAVSPGVADRVGERIGSERVVQVGNGIDTRVFSPQGPVASEAPHAPYLLYAGTASEWHGAGVFVEAMHQVHAVRPDARMVLLGQGADWERLRQAAARLPEGVVELRPRVGGRHAAAWLRGASAALASVLPGTPYEFAFPTKAYAAMACGTPVIYAGGGPAGGQITASGAGEAVPHEASEVAAAILRALDAPLADHERERLAAWAHEHASIDTVAVRAATVVRKAGRR